jgi:predicted P-loop ATPase
MAIPRNEEEAERRLEEIFAPWRDSLITTSKGTPKALLANAITAFRAAPEWSGIFQFDVFKQQTMLKGVPPWGEYREDRAWEDADDVRAADWCQHNGILIPKNVAGEAIEIVARDFAFHPVRDYIKRCQRTSDQLLDFWLSRFLGCPDTPIIRAFGRTFLISAIARMMEPGCKADCALILEGPQGRKKSTALRVLFVPWFTDEIADLGTKDAAMQLRGVWCIEIAELDAMGRGDVAKIKAFMSRTIDRFRPAYGHRVIEQLRQNVFAGTVNHNEYLRDATGGRRFNPAECGEIDIDGLTQYRDALWAEARDAYLEGEQWWIDGPLLADAVAEQRARRIPDPWDGEVELITQRVTSITASEVLIEIGIPLKDQTQWHWNRAADCLKALGWRSKSIRYKGSPAYRYVPPT